MIGLRIDCPWCPNGSVRADLLGRHLRREHKVSVLEATEVAERLRAALEELPAAQAIAFAFTGMRLPPLDAREALAGMRGGARAAATNRRSRQGRARVTPPKGYYLCLGCMTVRPAEEMAKKRDGRPAIICTDCHRILDNFRVPRWALTRGAI